MNRIAYQAVDGAIYTVGPDGSDRKRVSGVEGTQADAVNVWPVWSPDSGTILFSALSPVGDRAAQASLRRGGAMGGYEPVILHADTLTSNGINPGTPHYALWSPNGERVALITDAGQGIVTFTLDAETGFDVRGFYDGAPVYISWSADSQHMLVHVNESLFLWSRDPVTGQSTNKKIGSGSISYRAPQWHPHDNSYLYVDVVDGRRLLLLGTIGGSEPRLVRELDSAVEFTWAPDGAKIAVLSGSGEYFDRVEIIDSYGVPAGPGVEGEVSAAWWAPNGQRLLVASGSGGEEGETTWTVIEVQSGEVREVAKAFPSGPLYLMLLFYSQYAASHQLWSPDSQYFLIAGAMAGEEGDAGREFTGNGAEISRIWVIDADAKEPPVPVGEGLLASWSPT